MSDGGDPADPARPLRVLSISTLFPCPQRPGFGIFVANQMQAVTAIDGGCAVDLVMVNPIGLPPWPFSRRDPYRSLAHCPPSSQAGGVPTLHPRFTTIPRLGADSNPARIVRAVLPLARRLHAEQPFDLVDAQFYFPDGPAAHAIAADLGLPFTIKARGSDILMWGKRPAARRQILAAGGAAAMQLPVSRAMARDMVAMGLPEATIRVHYTGLDRARFYVRPRGETRAALAGILGLTLPGDAPLLVCPGALIPLKGHALAIEALALLNEAGSSGGLAGGQLLLVGSGPEEASLRARAARGDVAGRVHVLGQVGHDVLPMVMAAADALVLPSEYEGLANVWVEAMACGTPLVIPDVGGAREVVTSPSAGRIAERTPAAIAAALRDLLATPPAQADVAANVAEFSWDKNAAKLVACWREAVGGR